MRAVGGAVGRRGALGAEHEAHQRRDRAEADPGDVDDEEHEHRLLDAGQPADRRAPATSDARAARSAGSAAATRKPRASRTPGSPRQAAAAGAVEARSGSARASRAAPAAAAAPAGRPAAAPEGTSVTGSIGTPRSRRPGGRPSGGRSRSSTWSLPSGSSSKLRRSPPTSGFSEMCASCSDPGFDLRRELHRRGLDHGLAVAGEVDDEAAAVVAAGADQRARDAQQPARIGRVPAPVQAVGQRDLAARRRSDRPAASRRRCCRAPPRWSGSRRGRRARGPSRRSARPRPRAGGRSGR